MRNFVKVLDVKNDGVMLEDMPLIEGFFQKHPEAKAFVLRRHGLVAYGKSALEAEHNAELVEEMAQLDWSSCVYQKAVSREELPLGQEWFDAFKEKNN